MNYPDITCQALLSELQAMGVEWQLVRQPCRAYRQDTPVTLILRPPEHDADEGLVLADAHLSDTALALEWFIAGLQAGLRAERQRAGEVIMSMAEQTDHVIASADLDTQLEYMRMLFQDVASYQKETAIRKGESRESTRPEG